MNDAGSVGLVERVGDLDRVMERLNEGRRALLQPVFQGLALRYCMTRNDVPSCSPIS